MRSYPWARPSTDLVARVWDLPVSQGKSRAREKPNARLRVCWLTCSAPCSQVKCDERPGGCHNCARLNLPCPNSPEYHGVLQAGEAEGQYLRTQAGLRRTRTYRSCRGCRTSKSRCSGERPVCSRCHGRKIVCCYDGKQAPAWMEAASREAEENSASRGETWVTPSLSLLKVDLSRLWFWLILMTLFWAV